MGWEGMNDGISSNHILFISFHICTYKIWLKWNKNSFYDGNVLSINSFNVYTPHITYKISFLLNFIFLLLFLLLLLIKYISDLLITIICHIHSFLAWKIDCFVPFIEWGSWRESEGWVWNGIVAMGWEGERLRTSLIPFLFALLYVFIIILSILLSKLAIAVNVVHM